MFRSYKQKWRRLSKKNLCRTYALIVISVLCSIDIIYSIVYEQAPYISDFMRPVVVLIFLSSTRSNFKQLLFNVRDSIAILLAILIYIGFFAILGYYLFRSNL